MFCPSSAPGLLVTGRAGSHLNTMCCPPRGVTSVWVAGRLAVLLDKRRPDLAAVRLFRLSWVDRDRPPTRRTAPHRHADHRARPRCHQPRIVASSVVAAFKPPLTNGALFVGLHGNTGQPRRA